MLCAVLASAYHHGGASVMELFLWRPTRVSVRGNSPGALATLHEYLTDALLHERFINMLIKKVCKIRCVISTRLPQVRSPQNCCESGIFKCQQRVF
jgi:hypothetical protein